MYLSKVQLSPSHQSAKELISLDGMGVYTSHQLLWQLFRQQDERGFLFREEQYHQGMPEYYVLSNIPPQLDHPILRVNTKPFNPQLGVGQQLAFTLRANPTICVKDGAGKSKRHDVLMHAKSQFQQLKQTPGMGIQDVMNNAAQTWIGDEKRLKRWGIQLNAVPEVLRYTQHRSHQKAGQKITFSSVDYHGILTVADPMLFLQQHSMGFGRAKGFGCGLMLIRGF